MVKIPAFQIPVCPLGKQYEAYSSCGSYIYSAPISVDNSTFTRSQIIPTNAFWINYKHTSECGHTPKTTQTAQQFASMTMNRMAMTTDSSNVARSAVVNTVVYDSTGPLNRCGIWACGTYIDSLRSSFEISSAIPVTVSDTFYIGMAADNEITVTIDGQVFRQDIHFEGNGSDPIYKENFTIWHIYPIYLAKGTHTLKIYGWDGGVAASVGVEIYHNTLTQIRNARSYSDLDLVYSTKDLASRSYAYGCPVGYSLDSTGGVFSCNKTVSPVIRTNPYVLGVVGNWRNSKSYVYYGNRAETDPLIATNIRQNGTFKDYTSFWQFQNTRLLPQYDTNRWVWNSESTLFNKKGFELENKDPLGRYNAGLYGYNQTLPIAVAQNSKYRESAFDGFEDYDYALNVCDTNCTSIARQFDFTSAKNNITTAQKHSGKSSLRVDAGSTISVTTVIAPDNVTQPDLSFTMGGNSCVSGQFLKGISLNNTVNPAFTPVTGRKMLLSIWVKEDGDCLAQNYSQNQIQIVFDGSAQPVIAKPTGEIIDVAAV